jgi:hypothetical protein
MGVFGLRLCRYQPIAIPPPAIATKIIGDKKRKGERAPFLSLGFNLFEATGYCKGIRFGSASRVVDSIGGGVGNNAVIVEAGAQFDIPAVQTYSVGAKFPEFAS